MTNYHPAINNLNVIYREEFDRTYYATDGMIYGGDIFIEEDVLMGADNDVSTYITVKCLSKDNAELITMYDGDLLASIQTYRILKDIKELYHSHDLVDFLKIMRELSISYMSSSMQSKAENRINIRADIQEDLKWIKEQFL